MLRNYAKLPPRSKRILPWMMAQNWLTGYANLTDLHRSFTMMSRRTSFESHMENAVDFLKLHYADFEEEFHAFFSGTNSLKWVGIEAAHYRKINLWTE